MKGFQEIVFELEILKNENESLKKIIKSLKDIIKKDGEEIERLNKNIITKNMQDK